MKVEIGFLSEIANFWEVKEQLMASQLTNK